MVLILIMAGLLVYLLFGDKIADRLFPEEQTPPVEDVTPETPDTDTALPEEGDDVTMPEDGELAGETGGEETGTPAGEPADPSTLPETLTIAYLGSPRTEFTMSVGDEPIPLTASGGNGTYTWSSSDDGIASVDADGHVTAVSQGSEILATLVNGDTVRILQSAGNSWYQISYVDAGGQSATGYMMGDYLSNT